jgi:beta-galactosidase
MFKLVVHASLVAGVALTAVVANPLAQVASNRVTINLGATPWKLVQSDPQMTATGPQTASYNDAAAMEVGIPHSFNEDQSFVNNKSGGGNTPYGPYWYRKKFTLDPRFADRKIFLEFEGAHMGVQVYVNGTLLQGTSAANPNATHVVGFIGFLYDITGLVKFDGSDNIVAARVGMGGAFFTDPGFSGAFRFGQGSGGLFRPVWLHLTDKVHIPSNVYSGTQQWGTYVATTNVAADGASATVRIFTNVQNESGASRDVTLIVKVVEAVSGTIVLSNSSTQTIAAGQVFTFDQSGTVVNPKLWYPNNSPFGKPNMHRVYHIVKVGGAVVDVVESPLGIRTITWDKDFPYINGHRHCLYGASGRYDYPALGTGVPAELEWRDAKLLADVGGSLWRPGHSSCSKTFVEACDAFGIMLVQPSGEGEGAFASDNIGSPASKRQLKKEIHRDMIIRDRNNPSILSWEASNAGIDSLYCDTLRTLGKTWDSLAPRAMAVRGTPYTPGSGDLHGCTVTGCDARAKTQAAYNPYPWWGSEYWGRHSSRIGYDFQIQFSAEYLRDWAQGIANKCFGMCQWYLMETPGEDPGAFLEGGGDTRSFGCSMMDFNRIPKFLYYQYGACWIPYALQPRVAIAHHWNRTGAVRVNVFSNCPRVRLSLNGTPIGEKVPNPQLGVGGITDLTNTTTQLPFQCYWDGVAWLSGVIKAEGLNASGVVVCTDSQVTAGAPDHIVLTKVGPIVKPDGKEFAVTANGSDAALILATVVDNKGIWCPTAGGTITFSVVGAGTYRGGSDQFVTAGQPLTYHSPKDPELTLEGGKAMVAIRSKFTTGTVTVSATAAGLPQPAASISYTIAPRVDTIFGSIPSVYAGTAVSPARQSLSSLMRQCGRLVQYYIDRASTIGIDLLGANGRVVARIPVSKMEAGWHTVNVTNSGLGAGVYFVRLIADGKVVQTKRLLLVK